VDTRRWQAEWDRARTTFHPRLFGGTPCASRQVLRLGPLEVLFEMNSGYSASMRCIAIWTPAPEPYWRRLGLTGVYGYEYACEYHPFPRRPAGLARYPRLSHIGDGHSGC